MADKSFKGMLSETVGQSGFTLGIHRFIGVCDIFVLHFFCVPRMLHLHVSKPGGKKGKRGRKCGYGGK